MLVSYTFLRFEGFFERHRGIPTSASQQTVDIIRADSNSIFCFEASGNLVDGSGALVICQRGQVSPRDALQHRGFGSGQVTLSPIPDPVRALA